MMNLKRLGTIFSIVVGLLLSGCGTTQYLVDNKSYTSSESALDALRIKLKAIENELQPSSSTPKGKAVIITPSKKACKAGLSIQGRLTGEHINYLLNSCKEDYASFSNFLVKSNLFASVEHVIDDYPRQHANEVNNDYDAKIYLDTKSPSRVSWFMSVLPENTPKQLKMEQMAENETLKIQSWLNDVKSHLQVATVTDFDNTTGRIKETTKMRNTDSELIISIAEFKNLSEISEYDWLSIAIPELASTFLSRMKGISLVERAELKRFLDERELELSGLISNSTLSEQLLLGAQYIVLGSYRISGNNVDINARMIKTETGELLRAESVVGEISRIGELVQNLTLRMSGVLGHKLTAEERTRIQQDGINMLKTIKAISQGQLFYEAGKFDKARAVYKEALRENRGNAELLERIKDIDVTLNAISVVAFKNNSGKHKYDYLSNAIPESLSTSLIKKTGLPFAERLNLEKALEEMEIGMTGIIEPATAASVGKLAGATQLVIGSFQVHDTNLTVFAKIIDTENGLVAANESTTGNISDIPRIANDLADKLVGTLSSVRVTKEAKRSIGRFTEQMSGNSKKIALILEESMVGFNFNKAILKPSSYPVLNLLSDALINFPEYRIVIIGHTDSKGTEKYNEQLSSNRAKSVLQYMKSRSVSVNRMTSIGYGETRPRDSNDTPEGRAKNRRVEYELIKQ